MVNTDSAVSIQESGDAQITTGPTYLYGYIVYSTNGSLAGNCQFKDGGDGGTVKWEDYVDSSLRSISKLFFDAPLYFPNGLYVDKTESMGMSYRVFVREVT